MFVGAKKRTYVSLYQNTKLYYLVLCGLIPQLGRCVNIMGP